MYLNTLIKIPSCHFQRDYWTLKEQEKMFPFGDSKSRLNPFAIFLNSFQLIK